MTARHDSSIHVALSNGILDGLHEYNRACHQGDFAAAAVAAHDIENMAKRLAEECNVSHAYFEDLRGFSRPVSPIAESIFEMGRALTKIAGGGR